ncbi:MAG TPA: hypothetical protein PK544_16980 [Spirochaetota bacterium]|nr:hypothetical protein [Spirochaetota bacterium]
MKSFTEKIPSTPAAATLLLQNALQWYHTLQQVISANENSPHFTEESLYTFRLALDELLTNAMSWELRLSIRGGYGAHRVPRWENINFCP